MFYYLFYYLFYLVDIVIDISPFVNLQFKHLGDVLFLPFVFSQYHEVMIASSHHQQWGIKMFEVMYVHVFVDTLPLNSSTSRGVSGFILL